MARSLLCKTLCLPLLVLLLIGVPAESALAQGGRGGLRRPVLVAPEDTVRFQPARPRFCWESVDSGSVYVLQVAGDSAFALRVVTDTLRGDTVFVPARLLLNDSTYFWRVGVRTPGDSSIFSPVRSFTVASVPDLSPASLFLGYVRRGDTSRAAAVVRNPLPLPISLDSIRSQTGLFRAETPLPAVVDSLDSLVLVVSYVPREFLLTADSLSLCTSLGEHTLRVAGDSPPPLCMAATDSIAFGPVAVGDTASEALVVHNRGVVNPLQVGRLSFRSRAFRIRAPAPRTIQPRDSAAILIEFVPASPRSTSDAPFADTLTVDSDGGRALVRLAGESPPPHLVTLPGSVDFGESAIRDSVLCQIRLVNASINGLRIDSVRTRRQAFSGGPRRGILRLRDTMAVRVRFLPLRYGAAGDVLQIFSNAPGSPHEVPLRGVAPPPALVTDLRAMNFGEVPSGESVRLVLGISNTSLSPLVIDSVTTATGRFRVERFPVFTHLLKGDTLRLPVTFLPDTAGGFQDTLVIASNSPAPPFRVFLSGVGRVVQGMGETEGFALFQNFPNPFREVTTFRYALRERCSVRLLVSNALGQIVATVVDGEREAGNHNVLWRPEAASGMYFYKLIAVSTENPDRQHVASKRLMILR